jgi:hypothetical protein
VVWGVVGGGRRGVAPPPVPPKDRTHSRHSRHTHTHTHTPTETCTPPVQCVFVPRTFNESAQVIHLVERFSRQRCLAAANHRDRGGAGGGGGGDDLGIARFEDLAGGARGESGRRGGGERGRVRGGERMRAKGGAREGVRDEAGHAHAQAFLRG